MLPRFAVFGLLCLTSLASATAAEPPEIPLFDGTTLSGWIVEDGAAADVVDGTLRLKQQRGWLRSPFPSGDFDLRMEWKTKSSRGFGPQLLVGAALNSAGKLDTATTLILRGRRDEVPSVPFIFVPEDLLTADWNTLELQIRSQQLVLKVNGTLVFEGKPTALKPGFLGLWWGSTGDDEWLIRKLTIREQGYQSLFDGKSLAGWEPIGKEGDCWSVVDGLLVCHGQPGPWLRSAQEYGDFSLRFDYQLSAEGNSGIYVRVPADGNHHREKEELPPAGFEVQLLDDAAEKHAKLKDYQYSASVYDIAGASPRNSRPPGEWNTMDLICRGQSVKVVHNGAVVIDINDQSHPLLALRKTSGYLGLQNHSTVVRFRNLRISPFTSSK